MSSWRPLIAGTVGLFLVILAFLAGQLKGGGDPALGQSRAAATQQATPAPQQDFGGGPRGSESDSSLPDVSPPTTHQS
ncbi:MAG: hypothetical protein ABI611_01850 [Solirubrobacteraceae bacterium]